MTEDGNRPLEGTAEQPATSGETAPAPAAGTGSAEARELERQLDELRERLRQAETRALENLDRWQRAQADLANYRRRAQFEREELEKFATMGVVASILPVLDSFERAWGSLPGEFRRLTWLAGVAMIHSQLRGTLERIGLNEVPAQGQPFDPAVHEAVDRDPGDGEPHVVAVLQAGYRLHDRLLRPALVKVGPKPAESPPPPAEGQAPGEPGTAPTTGPTTEA